MRLIGLNHTLISKPQGKAAVQQIHSSAHGCLYSHIVDTSADSDCVHQLVPMAFRHVERFYTVLLPEIHIDATFV